MQPFIRGYQDFVKALEKVGFSMGGGNSEGIFSLIPWGWNEEPPYDTPVRWHTGKMELDPWEWRIRVLDEREDIAYGKLFFKKSGYMTRAWAADFLAARRGVQTFGEAYAAGLISQPAKRIYGVVAEHEMLPVHAIKQLAGFGKEEKAVFERGLTELQMKMYLTLCGRQQKLSVKGAAYGWASTAFCTTEHFWGQDIFKKAETISKKEAMERITEQILRLNPQAEAKKITRFILG